MATITITTTANQTARIQTAFGQRFNPPRDATAQEVKDFLIAYIKSVVHPYETKVAADAAANAVVPMPDPT